MFGKWISSAHLQQNRISVITLENGQIKIPRHLKCKFSKAVAYGTVGGKPYEWDFYGHRFTSNSQTFWNIYKIHSSFSQPASNISLCGLVD